MFTFLIKKFIGFIIISFFLSIPIGVLAFFSKEKAPLNFENSQKEIYLSDNGLDSKMITRADSIKDFLEINNLTLSAQDKITPGTETKILPGMNIAIRRAVKITISADGEKVENYTLAKNVLLAAEENGFTLWRHDQISPEKTAPLRDGEKIIITRINIEEVTKQEDIDFKTIAKNDSKLSWREKKIEQKGEKGIREAVYQITYKNGREISRIVISKKIAKEPISQIEIQGTYVKLGKTHTGQGTWYAFKGGLFAANPWLPMGSYVKVTNKANGKSVIVQINDRGPFGAGRIIDLDKVAFAKIASLGAGVIDVKMEEITN